VTRCAESGGLNEGLVGWRDEVRLTRSRSDAGSDGAWETLWERGLEVECLGLEDVENRRGCLDVCASDDVVG
jgi:hypothetical protein